MAVLRPMAQHLVAFEDEREDSSSSCMYLLTESCLNLQVMVLIRSRSSSAAQVIGLVIELERQEAAC